MLTSAKMQFSQGAEGRDGGGELKRMGDLIDRWFSDCQLDNLELKKSRVISVNLEAIDSDSELLIDSDCELDLSLDVLRLNRKITKRDRS